VNWQGHVVVVTGAGSGIGLGIAEVFAEAGAEVVIGEVNEERGRAAEASLQRQYGRGLFVATDVAVDAACRNLMDETVRRYGQIDTLVNNAGVNFVKPTLEMAVEDWDRVVNVDLRGTFLCSKYALAHMVPRRKGSIINIASVHTRATLGGAAPYAAAKGGVQQMTASMAIEFAPYGIRINALSPGLIDTIIWQQIQQAAEDLNAVRQHWMDAIPLGREGQPREMGQVALFLASDAASYVTGANLLADGGMTSQLINRERYASKPLEGEYK
jgi:NAD(P)-dependent dehydrogenase (short-subunit alcohol dehydrogenase family)